MLQIQLQDLKTQALQYFVTDSTSALIGFTMCAGQNYELQEEHAGRDSI